MILLILLILITVLLSITYFYVRSWKKYIAKSWNNGIKKGLNISRENLQQEILKNNKKYIAILIFYPKINYNYWKYTHLLNIESSALNFLLKNEDLDINTLIKLRENEILNISDIFYDVNKKNIDILKEKNTQKEDSDIKKYIVEIKKGKNICSTS